MRRTKNKTAAAWLAFLGGPLGLHRFYLRGPGDWLGWLLPLPTVAGLYGIARVQQYGVDDPLSWVLIPLLGFNIAACALVAIIYGLKTREEWNARFNPGTAPDGEAGATNWFTIGAIVLSLMIGTGCLMATLAYGFYNYFNAQIEEGRRISE
jgi:TM2 domain-containing membrane protein YozV